MRVEQIMSREVTSVRPDTSLKDVAEILCARGISGLPVVEAGRVVGVVSEADILVKERGPSSRRTGGLAVLLGGRTTELEAKLGARTAGDAMTSPAIVIDPRRPVSSAAELMLARQINRLPVVDKGELVGIVTRADLVRAFTRSDDEILREVRDEVILGTFWISPSEVTVEVKDGEVTLAGEVETELATEALPRVVARVPGVVGVASRLTARHTDPTPAPWLSGFPAVPH